MPVEQAPGADRRSVTHLEALGRLLAGIAPWLELGADGSRRGAAARPLRRAGAARDRARGRSRLARLPELHARSAAARRRGVPRAGRCCAPPQRCGTSSTARRNDSLIAALESTRVIIAALQQLAAVLGDGRSRAEGSSAPPGIAMRVDYALRQHEQWYKGDGAYGDGPDFHWDYYNSFVIHPMLIDVLDACAGRESPPWKEPGRRASKQRARRYAAVQERLIAPDGTFPAIGRSLAYRFGAFHLLAQIALRRALPDGVSPAQVRGALTAVIRRSIEAPGTFDATAGCGSASAAISRASARPTSRPAACISARSACCRSACRRPTSSGRRRRSRGRRRARGPGRRFRSITQSPIPDP